MTAQLMQINLSFNNLLRPEFDTEALIKELRAARSIKGLTIKQVADRCGVTPTEAEHWFRLDRYGSAPHPSVWGTVKDLLGIKGWDIVGEIIETPNTYDMSARAYHERGIAPTITVHNAGWIFREAGE